MSYSFGEEANSGTQQNETNKRAKEIVCEFINNINYEIAIKIKAITQGYRTCYELDNKISLINNSIEYDTNELKWSFKQTTKENLNQKLTNSRNKLIDINNSKSLVDNVYNEYIQYIKNLNEMENNSWKIGQHTLSLFNFFSQVKTCTLIPHTTSQYASIDDVAVAQATRLRNKYLKYKQKYLTLKNKIN